MVNYSKIRLDLAFKIYIIIFSFSIILIVLAAFHLNFNHSEEYIISLIKEQKNKELTNELSKDKDLQFKVLDNNLESPSYGFKIIHFAVQFKNYNLINYLINNEFHLNLKTKNLQYTALTIAILENDIKAASLLAMKTDILAKDVLGENVIFHSIQSKKAKTFLSLLKKHPDYLIALNSLNNNDETPIFHAVKDNKPEIIKEIIHNISSPNHHDQFNKTIYDYALENDANEIINLIKLRIGKYHFFDSAYNGNEEEAIKNFDHWQIDYKAFDKRQTSKFTGITPLHIAVYYNFTKLFDKIIQSGCDPNISMRNEFSDEYHKGLRPLHFSAHTNKIPLAKKLIENGANINIQNYEGESPLYMAALYGHIDILKFLISKGANLEIADIKGVQPIHIAARTGNIGVLSELIKQGANINCQDNNGKTPLYYATENLQSTSVKILISNRADINIADTKGINPLDLAYKINSRNIIYLLKRYKAKTNIKK